MSEFPPKITKNDSTINCPVKDMKPGSTGTIFLGEINNERIFNIEKPEANTPPLGARCRLQLQQRIEKAGIRNANLDSPCSWCHAVLREEKI
ncbi:MAG TPA: hypothetical protein VF189_06495 [Patescibacteria group bacterium]